MLDNFRFTLYELFGYLLPGSVALAALFIVYWACFAPEAVIWFTPFDLVRWVASVIVCYVFGHAVQALGNSLPEINLDTPNERLPQWLREQARRAATDLLNADSHPRLDGRVVVQILDEYALQNGKEGDREVFVYREGFYRGTSISLAMLSAALLLRALKAGAAIYLPHGVFALTWRPLLLTSVVSGVIAYLFFRRYQRFAWRRIMRTVSAALMLMASQKGNSRPSDDQRME